MYKPEPFNKKTRAISFRGINESKSKEAADRMQEDLCHEERILEHLNIEDRKITKHVRLGKYELSRDLILNSVSRLKAYKYKDRSIYISPELSPGEAKKRKQSINEKATTDH